MRFKVPRPLHGWREFSGEVGIIVVGVLIALVTQQFVDNQNWDQKTAIAEGGIRKEILDSAVVADERVRMNGCFVGKLNELQRTLVDVKSPITKPLYRSRYWTLVRLWSTDAWDTARASDVLTHLQPSKVRAYSAIYAQIAQVRDELDLEQQSIADLALLTWFTGPMSEVTRDRLLAAVTRAGRFNEMIVRDSKQIVAAAAELNIQLPKKHSIPDYPCGSMAGPMPAR